ncbi:WD40 repeat domain-containing protein [Rhodotorula paludigena]|uniref:WD40 repeat domain-containing protein n=1 Tax=Rhodotorula paludigena TaxID=86838 RepID=UPI00316B71A2
MASGAAGTPVKSTPLVCAGHTRPIPSIHFSPLLPPTAAAPNDPNYLLVSACKDGKPQLRDWCGDWLGTFTGDNGHKGAVWSARLSRDGSLAATGSADFTAKVWDTHSGNCLVTLPHSHIVRTADLSSTSSIHGFTSPSPSASPSLSSPSSDPSALPSQLRLLTGGHEKRLRLWDLSRAPRDGSDASATEGVDEFRRGGDREKTAHEGTIKKVLWDEERQACVSMGEDRTIRWWDLRTLEQTHETTFSDQPISSMEKSHDGEFLAITTGKDAVFLSLDSRLPLMTHTLPYTPSSVSLHPTTRSTFVTGSLTDEWVRVHSSSLGAAELEVGKGHHGPVHAVQYSPDGELYASGSEDGTIRLWQTRPRTYGLWRYHPEDGEGAEAS